MPRADDRALPFADLYIRIHATADEVRGQSEEDWQMVAEALGLKAPKLKESRELIARLVEERNDAVREYQS